MRSNKQEILMAATNESVNFEALDACHQQTLVHLSGLAALIEHIETAGVDDIARHDAGQIETFFSNTSRAHHAEEEKTVFPPLLSTGGAEMVAVVRRLQQDHGWIEENWIELAPQLRAIAMGNTWLDAAEFQHYAEVFLELCKEHIALEESLIYPESKAKWAGILEARAARLAQAPP
jgi:hemerythrin-like domain-containing protein